MEKNPILIGFREANFTSSIDPAFKVWEGLTFCSNIIVVLLNLWVLILLTKLLRASRKKNTSKLFIFSLSCCDCMTGLAFVSYNILSLTAFSEVLFNVIRFVAFFTMQASLLHVSVMTTDQLLAACFPFQYIGKKAKLPALKSIVCIWVLSATTTCLSYLNVYYFGLVLSAIILLLVIFLPVAYVIIFLRITKFSREQAPDSQSKCVKMMKWRGRAIYYALVVTGFIISSFPMAMVTCLNMDTVNPHLIMLPWLLISLNGLWNSVLYLYKSRVAISICLKWERKPSKMSKQGHTEEEPVERKTTFCISGCEQLTSFV